MGDGVEGFRKLCEELDLIPDSFDALALAFCCGSMHAQSLSSRRALFDTLASECCCTVERLKVLLPSMRERVCSEEYAPEFWDWLFRSLCTTASSPVPGNYKRLRLYEKQRHVSLSRDMWQMS